MGGPHSSTCEKSFILHADLEKDQGCYYHIFMTQDMLKLKSFSDYVFLSFVELLLPKLTMSQSQAARFAKTVKDHFNEILYSTDLDGIVTSVDIIEGGDSSNGPVLTCGDDQTVLMQIPLISSKRIWYFQLKAKSCDVSCLSALLLMLHLSITRVIYSEPPTDFTEEAPVGIPPEIVAKIKKAASSSLPCLILGETGVGKEIVAEMIHRFSGRPGPFIALNCSAIPHGLFENELFGHEPNSFTGASKTGAKGKIELANGGTLFLDEIGEISLFTQSKLLRVVEKGEFWKIGAVKPAKVDVKFIAATNRPLQDYIRRGKFRKDLYYRLKGIEIYIPPLRERVKQIDELVSYFLQTFSNGKVYFTEEGMNLLRAYQWPGNVRQLQYTIQSLVDEVKQGPISIQKIKSTLELRGTINTFDEARKHFERRYIHDALELNNWNVTRTAQYLGMSRRWLQIKMKELGFRDMTDGEQG